jgi:hypothetical protein
MRYTSNIKKISILISLLLLAGCGTGAMHFYNPETKSSIECSGGVGWQAQANKELCVKSAMNSGFKLQGQ